MGGVHWMDFNEIGDIERVTDDYKSQVNYDYEPKFDISAGKQFNVKKSSGGNTRPQ